jgi:hypothetical protein
MSDRRRGGGAYEVDRQGGGREPFDFRASMPSQMKERGGINCFRQSRVIHRCTGRSVHPARSRVSGSLPFFAPVRLGNLQTRRDETSRWSVFRFHFVTVAWGEQRLSSGLPDIRARRYLVHSRGLTAKTKLKTCSRSG